MIDFNVSAKNLKTIVNGGRKVSKIRKKENYEQRKEEIINNHIRSINNEIEKELNKAFSNTELFVNDKKNNKNKISISHQVIYADIIAKELKNTTFKKLKELGYRIEVMTMNRNQPEDIIHINIIW